jgi:hypothetical protein
MSVFVNGRTVETDRGIYEFADAGDAEAFIDCLCNMDESSACRHVVPVVQRERPRRGFWSLLQEG